MAKKNFTAALQSSVEKQDESLKKRFENADSASNLLGAPIPPAKAPKSTRKAAVPNKEKVPKKPSGQISLLDLKVKKPQAETAARDTFSMPKAEYETLDKLRMAAAKKGLILNKSEIVRAGLLSLNNMSNAALLKHFGKVIRVKPGRK